MEMNSNRRLHRNRKAAIKPGDVYRVTNAIKTADVDGDGSADLTLQHTVTRNGELFFQQEAIWYGIDPFVAQAFSETLKEHVGTDIACNSFGRLVKHWKTLNKSMAKIMDVGEDMAKAIGEPAD